MMAPFAVGLGLTAAIHLASTIPPGGRLASLQPNGGMAPPSSSADNDHFSRSAAEYNKNLENERLRAENGQLRAENGRLRQEIERLRRLQG